MSKRPLAVPEGFTLPWNTTRTMADVFAERSERQAKAARETVAKAREIFVREREGKCLTIDGRARYAGFDIEEYRQSRRKR